MRHDEFIRTLPCVYCLRHGVQVAHTRKGTNGGMGQKPSEEYTVPLCPECHSRQHSIGEVSFWGDIDLIKILAKYLHRISGNKDKAIDMINTYRRMR